MDRSLIGIGVALGVSFFILYTRKKKWMSEIIVWLISIALLCFGLFGFFYFEANFRSDRVMYYGFCVPIIYWMFDRIFKRISKSMHKRDFILFLRHSDEINDSTGAKNLNVKTSDKFFSFGILIVIATALIIGIQII